MISKEIANQFFRYDKETGNLYWKVKRSSKTDTSKPISTKDKDGYIKVYTNIFHGKSKILSVHRIIWAMHYDDPGDMLIDHKNRVVDDNRIENLRLATRSQNQQNRKKRKDSKNKYKGIYKLGGKWAAVFQKDGQRCYLGRFDTPESAAFAYQEFARFTNGEFAV